MSKKWISIDNAQLNEPLVIKDLTTFELMRRTSNSIKFYERWLKEPERCREPKKFLVKMSKNLTSLHAKVQKSLLSLDSNPKIRQAC